MAHRALRNGTRLAVLIATLALIACSQDPANLSPETRATPAHAEKECAGCGVRLIVLYSTKPDPLHNRPAATATKECPWPEQA